MPDIFDEMLDGAPASGQLQLGGDSRRMLLNSVLHAISGQESGGDYRVVNPDSGARGRYQIMPANWPRWSRKYLGYVADPKDPQAQEVVAQRELGGYLDEGAQHGLDLDGQVRYAAAKWYSGRGYKMDDPTPQGKYPSVQNYTYSVLGKAKHAMGVPAVQASPAAYSQGDPFDELLGDAGQGGEPQQALPAGWQHGRPAQRQAPPTDAEAYFMASQQGHGSAGNGLAVGHSNGTGFNMRRGAVGLDPSDPYRSGIAVPAEPADGAPVSRATRMRIKRLSALRSEYTKALRSGNVQTQQALLKMVQQEGAGLHMDAGDDATALAYLHAGGKVGTPEEIEQTRQMLHEQNNGPDDPMAFQNQTNQQMIEGAIKMNPLMPLGPVMWGLAKGHELLGGQTSPEEQQALSEGPFGGLAQQFGAIGKGNRRYYEQYKHEFGYKPGEDATNAYQRVFQGATLQPLVQLAGSGLSKLTGHDIDPSMKDPIEALNQFTAGLTGVQGEDLAHDPEFQKLSPQRQQAYLDRQWYRGLIPSNLGGLLAYAPAMAAGPVSPLVAGYIGSQHAHAAYTNNVAGVDAEGHPTTYNPYDVPGSEAQLAGHEAEGLVSGAAMDIGGKVVGEALHAITPEALNPFAQNLIGRAGSAAGAVGGIGASGALTGHWADGRDYIMAGLVGAAMHNSYEGKVYVASPDGRFGRVDAFGRVSVVDEAATRRGDAPVIQWAQVAPRGMSFDAVFSPEGGAQPKGLFNQHPIFAASQSPRAVGFLREALPDMDAAYSDYDGYVNGMERRSNALRHLAEYAHAASKGPLEPTAQAEQQAILQEFPEYAQMGEADLTQNAQIINLRGQNAARLLENPEFAGRYAEQLTQKAEATEAQLTGYKQDEATAKQQVGEAAQGITEAQQAHGQAQQRMAELQKAFQDKQVEAKRYALYLSRLYAPKHNARTNEVEKGSPAIPEHAEVANRIETELTQIQQQMNEAQVEALKAEQGVKTAEQAHHSAEAALAHAGENLKRGQEQGAAIAEGYRARAENVAKVSQDYLTQRREAEAAYTSDEGRGALDQLNAETLKTQLGFLGIDPQHAEALAPVFTDMIRGAKTDGLNPNASLADKAQFVMDTLVGSREFNDVLGTGRKGLAQLFGGDPKALAARITEVEARKGNVLTPEQATQQAEGLIGEGANKALYYDNQIWLGAKANVSSIVHEFFHALDMNNMLPFKTARVLDGWAQSYWESNRDWVLKRNPNLADFPEGPGRDGAARAEIKVAALEGLLRDGQTPEGTPRAISENLHRMGDAFKDIYTHAFGTHLIDPSALPTDVRDMFRGLLGDQLVDSGARVAKVEAAPAAATAAVEGAPAGNMAGSVTVRGKSSPVMFADSRAREGYRIGEALTASKADDSVTRSLVEEAGKMGIAVSEARRYFTDLYKDMRRQLDDAVPEGDGGAVFLSRRLPEPKAGDSPAMLAAKATARRLYNSVVDSKVRLQGPTLQALRTDLASVLGRTPTSTDVDAFLATNMPAQFFHAQAKADPGEAAKWTQMAITKEAQVAKAADVAARAVAAQAQPAAVARLQRDLDTGRDEPRLKQALADVLDGADGVQGDDVARLTKVALAHEGGEPGLVKALGEFKGSKAVAQRLLAVKRLFGARRNLLDAALKTSAVPEGATREEAAALRALGVVDSEGRQPIRGQLGTNRFESAVELASFRKLDGMVAGGELTGWRRLNGKMRIAYNGRSFEPDIETDLPGGGHGYIEVKPLTLFHPGKGNRLYDDTLPNDAAPQDQRGYTTKNLRKAIEGSRTLGDKFDVWTEGSLGNDYVADTLRQAAAGTLEGYKGKESADRLNASADITAKRGKPATLKAKHDEAMQFVRDRAAQPQAQAALAQPTSIALNDNFHEWFGKSEARDEQGNPKVYYHGTAADFAGFDPTQDKSTGLAPFTGQPGAIYLTPDAGLASRHAWAKAGGPDDAGMNIVPVYAKAEHPFDFENPEHVSALVDWLKARNMSDGFVKDMRKAIEAGDYQAIQSARVQKFIRLAGHDAFYTKHRPDHPAKNLAVFAPTQVKGVFNGGDWDGSKPDLLAQPAGLPADSLHEKRLAAREGVEVAQRNAAAYAADRGYSEEQLGYRPVDEATQRGIGATYDAVKHAPEDPAVQRTYKAIKTETADQFDFLRGQGVTFEAWRGEGQPYTDSKDMMADVAKNHLYFFTGGDMPADHPLAADAGITVKGSDGSDVPLNYNDVFRAVHDYFGHSTEGYQFGVRGEYNATRAHSRLYSPEAQDALLSETLGQNSWVNFGKHLQRPDGTIPAKGEPDFIHPADRPFAEQKAAILPGVREQWQNGLAQPGGADDFLKGLGIESGGEWAGLKLDETGQDREFEGALRKVLVPAKASERGQFTGFIMRDGSGHKFTSMHGVHNDYLIQAATSLGRPTRAPGRVWAQNMVPDVLRTGAIRVSQLGAELGRKPTEAQIDSLIDAVQQTRFGGYRVDYGADSKVFAPHQAAELEKWLKRPMPASRSDLAGQQLAQPDGAHLTGIDADGKTLADKLGTTDELGRAGFVLPDGTMVPKGARTHELALKDAGITDPMHAYLGGANTMRVYSPRENPAFGGRNGYINVDVSSPLTTAQADLLASNGFGKPLRMDVSAPDGTLLGSTTLDKLDDRSLDGASAAARWMLGRHAAGLDVNPAKPGKPLYGDIGEGRGWRAPVESQPFSTTAIPAVPKEGWTVKGDQLNIAGRDLKLQPDGTLAQPGDAFPDFHKYVVVDHSAGGSHKDKLLRVARKLQQTAETAHGTNFPPKANSADFAAYKQEAVRRARALGGEELTDFVKTFGADDPKMQELIKGSFDWYHAAITRTQQHLAKIPGFEQLAVDDNGKPVNHRESRLFRFLLGSFSPGVDPDVNLRAAADLYIDYTRLRKAAKDRGANMPLPLVDVSKTVNVKDQGKQTDELVGGGSYSRVGFNNIIKINRLAAERYGGDLYKAVDWLLKPHDIKDVAEVYGYVAKSEDGFHPADFRGQIDDQTGDYTYDDSMVHNGKALGAYAFGPKVGAFIANINGLKGELTPDLWWSRTWNRWQGSLLYPRGKSAKQAAEDPENQAAWTGVAGIPRSKPERDTMRQGIGAIARDLTMKSDPDSPTYDKEFADALGLTGKHVFGPSEAQSMLWYMEQQYWAKQGHSLAKSRSYDGEAAALAKRWDKYDAAREGTRNTVAQMWLSADPDAVAAKLRALDVGDDELGPIRKAALELQHGLIKRVKASSGEGFVADLSKLYGLAQPKDVELFKGGVTPENFDEYLNRGGYVSDEHTALMLGDKPAYLGNVARYLLEQRAKVNEGRLTKRDVAKAYLLTLSSVNASEHKIGTVRGNATAKLPAEMHPDAPLARFPEINPEQFFSEKQGHTVVRPEDYFARFLFTDQGQAMLDGIESGKLDLQAAADVRGTFGTPSAITQAASTPHPLNPGTKYSLANLDEFVDALNAAGPQGPAAVDKVLLQTRGIAEAKLGFVKQLLGFGDSATVDAVEKNYWLGGAASAKALTGKPLEAAVVEHSKGLNNADGAKLRAWVEDRFSKVAELPQIKDQLSAEELDPNVFNTIMHHWLWDKAKQTETSHEGFYNAMRLAQPGAPALAAVQGQAQREGLVKRAFDAVSTFTRGSMLLNPATHGTNVVGNLVNRLRLDAGDLAATPLDFVASAFSKQHTKVVNPFDSLRALGATFSTKDGDMTQKGGLRRAWENLTLQQQGPQQNAPAAQQSLFKGQTLPKALANGFSAVAFGTLGAEDAFSFTYSLKKSMLDLARAQALTEYRSDKSISIRDRMSDLLANPHSDMVDQAEAEALMATFQNSTVPHEMVDAAKKAASKAPTVGPALKFALDQLVPFSKTPSAIGVSALDMLGGHGIRAVAAGAKWSAMLARGEAQDPLKVPEIRALQRQMVSQAGHQLVASTLMTLVAQGALGYIEPMIPEKDRQHASASDKTGMGWRGGRIRQGDYTYDLTGGGPTATAIMAAAAAGKEFRKTGSWTGSAAAALEQAGMAFLELPLIKGSADFNEALGDPDSKGAAFAASFAQRAVPFSGVTSAYARQQDPYERQAKTFGERVQATIPGYREQLQPKDDPLTGGPMARKAVSPFIPFKPQAYKGGDPVLRVVADLGIEPPKPDKRDGESDEALAARTKRTQEVWRDAIRQVLPDYAGKTDNLDDEAKKAMKKEVARRIDWRVAQVTSREFREPHKPPQPRF